MVKKIPNAAHRSSLTRRRSAGRGSKELPFCLTEFHQEGLPTRPYSPRGQSPRAQCIQGSNRGYQPRRVRCRYTMKRGPNAGLKCSKTPLSGDYCTQHERLIPSVTLPPPQAAVSSCGNRSQHVSYQCQALTVKGLNCTFKALPQERTCKRHLKQTEGTERSSLLLPRKNDLRFPPASSSFVPIPFDPSPQHEDELDLHQNTSSFAEQEALVPICRHCKLITLRNCNLCQSYGCKMRALSVVHEATELGHTQVIAPLVEDMASTSNSRPSPRHSSHKVTKLHTLSDILPKLKVCRPSDFGMPVTIPRGTNFYVWDRWWHVNESHLGPHAGMGLFTVHSIPKGEDLFPFIGPEYDKATFHQIEQVLPEIRYYALLYWDHTEQPSREVWIDGGTRHSNLAGYINSIHTEDSRKRANVHWEVRENRCQGRIPNNMYSFIMTVSIRPIASGEELYTTYDWQGAHKAVQQIRDQLRRVAAVPGCSRDQLDSCSRRLGSRKRLR